MVKHSEGKLFQGSTQFSPEAFMLKTKPAREAWREHMLLFREFVRYPFHTAALAPSSRHLAARMAESVPLKTARNVIELGPGTGALTKALLEKLNPDARFMAVELNPTFADAWARQFPDRKITIGNVANLKQICQANGFDSIDCIVSGLPWPSFPTQLQEKGVNEVLDMLTPGGQMVTFGYHVGLCMPTGRHFRRLIKNRFNQVEMLAWEWRNLPPAYILRCTR